LETARINLRARRTDDASIRRLGTQAEPSAIHFEVVAIHSVAEIVTAAFALANQVLSGHHSPRILNLMIAIMGKVVQTNIEKIARHDQSGWRSDMM
jgi:hypothetical protein